MISSLKHRIVVWDPKNEYWEGSVVDVSREVTIAARGAVLLPCMPELFRRGTGYVRRAWGAGFPLDAGTPRMHAPMSALIFRDMNTVRWAARLVSDAQYDADVAKPGFRPGGILRFVGDGREATHHIAISNPSPAVDVRELGEKDQHGGWTVSGYGRINPPLDGHFGFALYGNAAGLRIVWAAMTVTSEKL